MLIEHVCCVCVCGWVGGGVYHTMCVGGGVYHTMCVGVGVYHAVWGCWCVSRYVYVGLLVCIVLSDW